MTAEKRGGRPELPWTYRRMLGVVKDIRQGAVPAIEHGAEVQGGVD